MRIRIATGLVPITPTVRRRTTGTVRRRTTAIAIRRTTATETGITSATTPDVTNETNERLPGTDQAQERVGPACTPLSLRLLSPAASAPSAGTAAEIAGG